MAWPMDQAGGKVRERLARAAKCLAGRDEQSGRPAARRWWLGADDWEARLGRCGVSTGAVHEWFGDEQMQQGWLPPLSLLLDIARRMTRETPRGARVLWIGKRVWVYPGAPGIWDILERSVFVDPPGVEERVWAADVALRCRGAAVVVMDGSRLGMAQTRRLQLAAAEGGAAALVARPGWEVRELSAAKTRWRVTPAPSPARGPRWKVELLRCKDVNPVREEERRWEVGLEAGHVGVVPDVRDGPGVQAGPGFG